MEEAQVASTDKYNFKCCSKVGGRITFEKPNQKSNHRDAFKTCDTRTRGRLCTSEELQNLCARANVSCDYDSMWILKGYDPIADLSIYGGNDVFNYVKFPLAYSFSQTQHGVETMDGSYEYADFGGKFPGEIETVEGVWTMVSLKLKGNLLCFDH